MKQLFCNERGFSLVITLFTIVIITVLGMSMLILNNNSLKNSKAEEVSQSVFYIAESGITYRVLEIETEVDSLYEDFKIKFDKAKTEVKKEMIDKYPGNLYADIEAAILNMSSISNEFKTNESKAEVFTKKHSVISDYSREYELVSTGSIKEKKRTVSQTIVITIPDIGDGHFENNGGKFAVHTIGDINILGSGSIIGSVATQTGKITVSGAGHTTENPRISGDIGTTIENLKLLSNIKMPNKIIGFQPLPTEILPPYQDNKFIEFQSALTYSSNLPYPLLKRVPPKDLILIDDKGNLKLTSSGEFASNYSIKISNNMRFNNFEVQSGKTLTIDIGDSDKNLYINSLKISSGKIEVLGSGKLNIYIADEFNASSGVLSGGKNIDLNLYTNKLIISGGTEPGINISKSKNLNIFVNDTLDLSGNSAINRGAEGNANIYYLNKNSPSFGGSEHPIDSNIYAPNAKVTITGSRKVQGKIISKEFEISGYASRVSSEDSSSSGSAPKEGGGKSAEEIFIKPITSKETMVEE